MAKAKAGQLSIASAGNGSSNHLAIELLMRQANLEVVRRLLAEGDDCWTKIASFYRLSDAGPPEYADMRPFVQAVLNRGPLFAANAAKLYRFS